VRRISEIAAPVVDRVLAGNVETLAALCLEATEKGDHARAAWLANRIQGLRGEGK
jgi:hypothetical protein